MKAGEIVRTAIGNTFRSKLRTTLTVLAIFVGAFTLTLTNGIGTGIRGYIASQTSSLGGEDLMSITKASLMEGGGFGPDTSGPTEYDPDKARISAGGGFTFEALTSADLDAIAAVPGLSDVTPQRILVPDYIAYQGGRKFELQVTPAPPELRVELVTGRHLSVTAGTALPEGVVGELLLPVSYVEPLGFSSPETAVGAVVTVAASDPFGTQHEVLARVAGVQQASLFGDSALFDGPLGDAVFAAQTSGLPAAVTDIYRGATARYDPRSTPAQVTAIKSALRDLGLGGMTMADQLGAFQTVLDTIVGVLNAFAVIALIAAGFGIINTLLMSVQERTREIGLMKAMGLGAGKIFALFSTEAVFIGFLGSALGSLIAIGLGAIISEALANGPLQALQGLRILSFDPLNVLGVIALVMAIAFLAGTLPARRAAGLDPIDALRYE